MNHEMVGWNWSVIIPAIATVIGTVAVTAISTTSAVIIAYIALRAKMLDVEKKMDAVTIATNGMTDRRVAATETRVAAETRLAVKAELDSTATSVIAAAMVLAKQVIDTAEVTAMKKLETAERLAFEKLAAVEASRKQ